MQMKIFNKFVFFSKFAPYRDNKLIPAMDISKLWCWGNDFIRT